MAETTEPEAAPVWLSIPEGYAELPLDDIPETIEATRKLVDELGGPDQREAAAFVLSSLSVFLTTLADRNAVYCGVGRHRSALDGRLITSSLVVTVLDFPGERNPRLVLRDLLIGKARSHEHGQADLLDLDDGPAAFFEHTLTLPHPAVAGAEVPVWQLEAFVPAPAGDRLVTFELSTSFAEHGPQYRAMVVAMAGRLSFQPPAEEDPLSALLG